MQMDKRRMLSVHKCVLNDHIQDREWLYGYDIPQECLVKLIVKKGQKIRIYAIFFIPFEFVLSFLLYDSLQWTWPNG